jgi:hypothetical protein
VKKKKLKTEYDICDNQGFYQFSISLAYHHMELRLLWDEVKDCK